MPVTVKKGIATVKSDGKNPPQLTAGIIEPKVVLQYQIEVEGYCDRQKLTSAKEILDVAIRGVKGHSHWIHMNAENWRAQEKPVFSLKDFMDSMKDTFLKDNWMRTTLRKEVMFHQQETENFMEYSNRVMDGNRLLRGTDNALDGDELRKILETHRSQRTSEYVENNAIEEARLDGIKNLYKWIIAVHGIEAQLKDVDRRAKVVLREEKARKRQRTEYSVN